MITLQHFPDRDAASAAEVVAIKAEGPLYNIAENRYRRVRPSRDVIVSHHALHAPGEWCYECEGWPHQSATGPDGWCTRCDVHANDHEWEDDDWELYSREVLAG